MYNVFVPMRYIISSYCAFCFVTKIWQTNNGNYFEPTRSIRFVYFISIAEPMKVHLLGLLIALLAAVNFSQHPEVPIKTYTNTIK